MSSEQENTAHVTFDCGQPTFLQYFYAAVQESSDWAHGTPVAFRLQTVPHATLMRISPVDCVRFSAQSEKITATRGGMAADFIALRPKMDQKL